VDRSYTVHPEMKRHNRILMTIANGATYTASCKQKLNTKSSTEEELAGVNDEIGQILWTKHFLAAQGVHKPTTILYQDNKRTLLLTEIDGHPAQREPGT